MKSLHHPSSTAYWAYLLGVCLAVLPVARAQQQEAKNGLRIPYTIALTATSELEGELKEWTKNGANYVKETTKLNIFKVGNKQLLEILLEEGIIEDGVISGWALVEYLQTSGSAEDVGMFQQGAFLVKAGKAPIDVSDLLGYTLTKSEVESAEETLSEKNGLSTQVGKYSGQCIGKIQFAGINIGTGLAKYANSGTWSWTEDYQSYSWSEIGQTFSITGISGWLNGESKDDDPYGYVDEPTLEPYSPSNPMAAYLGYDAYDDTTSSPLLYFLDSDSDTYYYAFVDFSGPFYNDQDDEPYYPSNPQNQFQSLSLVSINGGPNMYRFVFEDSFTDITYYSNVQFDNLEYYRATYDDEEEDPVMIQGTIKAGKGSAIRLPELTGG